VESVALAEGRLSMSAYFLKAKIIVEYNIIHKACKITSVFLLFLFPVNKCLCSCNLYREVCIFYSEIRPNAFRSPASPDLLGELNTALP